MNITITLPEEYFQTIYQAGIEGLDARKSELQDLDCRTGRAAADLSEELRDSIAHSLHCLDRMIDEVNIQVKNEEQEDMESLTAKEVWAIENVISGEMTGNNNRLPHWKTPYAEAHKGSTWSDCVEHGGAKHGEKTTGKALAGVCGSLVQKGYMAAWGQGRDRGIEVTEDGWKAYQAWAEKNLKENGQ